MDQDQEKFEEKYNVIQKKIEDRVNYYKRKGQIKLKAIEKRILKILANHFIDLYKETSNQCKKYGWCTLSDKTKIECCCNDRYCQMIEDDLLHRGIKYKYAEGYTKKSGQIRFLGPNGCTIEPYYRPICSAHLCDDKWSDINHEDQDVEKKVNIIKRKIAKLANELSIIRTALGSDQKQTEILF